MGCVAITRSGTGRVWEFPGARAARLHPLVQVWDVVACSARDLAEQYDGRRAAELAALLPEGPLREEVRLGWGSRSEELRNRVWRRLTEAAQAPPADPAEVVRIVTRDREAMEGRTLIVRALPAAEEEARVARKQQKQEQAAAGAAEETKTQTEAEAKARSERIPDDHVITMGKDSEGNAYDGESNNPKREGSKTWERFKNYEDGITVKQAKERGLTAGDVLYDMRHGFIQVSPPAEQAQAAE